MTIMTETPTPATDQDPAKAHKHAKRTKVLQDGRNHPDPLVRHNIATWQGRVDPAYINNPYKTTIDGENAPAMDPADDSTYRRTTTSAEIARSVDRQIIGAAGTGSVRIEAAGRFSPTRTTPSVPAVGLAELLELRPHRAYRALAQLLDEDQIHSPYTQLADRLLEQAERTDDAARAVMEADENFPAEQMSLTYRSPAEKILASLNTDRSPDEETLDPLNEDEDEDESVQDTYERPDLTPGLVYTPTEQDYDEHGHLTVDALNEGDTDAWWQAEDQGRRAEFVALATQHPDTENTTTNERNTA